MNIKKIVTAVTIATMSAGVISANADYAVDETTGKITWDFAEYAGENKVMRKSSDDAYFYDYNGLLLGIDSADAEYIGSDGVYWKGPSLKYSSGDAVGNKRYITYTPICDGQLTIDFTSVTDKARIYVSKETETLKETNCMKKSNYVAHNMVSSAGGSATVTVNNAEKGTKYYIWSYDTTSGTTTATKIKKIEFTPDAVYKINESKTFSNGYNGDATAVEFTVTPNFAGNRLNVTYGEKTESLNTIIAQNSPVVLGAIIDGVVDVKDGMFDVSVEEVK